ncbi:MAG: nickel-dependent lactate racemase [Thermoplasmata archaeon]
MKIDIPYAGDKITLDVDEERVNGVLYPNEVPKSDEKEVLDRALEKPIDTAPFFEFVKDGTIIIVNDAARPTPTRRVLEHIKDVIADHHVSFIVATGSHREPTEEEYEWIFGSLWDDYKDKVHCHDSKNDEMVDFGKTSRGTPVKFNKVVCEAENVVAINTVEPHYFAGFTGGRKSLLPGVASYETITQNHFHALNEGAKGLELRGNPVHEDMIEAIKKFDRDVYAVNMTLDKDGDIYHASSGSIFQSFLNETKYALEVFSVPIEERSDVVMTVSKPIDIDLYQSQKSLENGKLALKDGGILILVSECGEGIGPENFYNLMATMDTPEEILEAIRGGYKLGYHKAAKIIGICERADIWSYTSLEDELLEKIFMQPKHDLQEAVDDALERTGGKITFLVEGGIVVPNVK